MLFTITGRHIDITDGMREHAEQKTSKLPRYYDKINQIEVIIEGHLGSGRGVEIIARGEHNKFFIATQKGEDVIGCIDSAVHKLEKQLKKTKSKERNKKHMGGA